jgi:Transposase IS116/IS110/IS902 family
VQELRPIYRIEADTLARLLENVRREIRCMDQEIKQRAKEDAEVGILTTVPGIGIFTALLSKAEARSFERFQTPAQLASYAGLVSSSCSSGGKIHLGRWPAPRNRRLWHMGLRRRSRGQALMRSFMVSEEEVTCEPLGKRWGGGIILQVKVFIRDGPPEAFNQEMVACAAPAIHADGNPRPRQAAGTGEARALDALLVMANHGRSLPQRPLARHAAAGGLHRMGQLPGEDIPALPVDDRDHRHAPLRHTDRGDGRTADLVGAAQDPRVQQRRGDRRLFGRCAGAWLGVDGLQPPSSASGAGPADG